MELKVGLRDAIRIDHVVIHPRPGEPVSGASVRLALPDRPIDGHVRHVDALRHQLPRKALGQARLGLAGHREGRA